MVQASDIARALEEQEHGDRRRLGEILVALGLAKQEDVLAAQQILEAKPRDTAPETIRVGVNLLDKLMTLVGELVLARNQLMQLRIRSKTLVCRRSRAHEPDRHGTARTRS